MGMSPAQCQLLAQDIEDVRDAIQALEADIEESEAFLDRVEQAESEIDIDDLGEYLEELAQRLLERQALREELDDLETKIVFWDQALTDVQTTLNDRAADLLSFWTTANTLEEDLEIVHDDTQEKVQRINEIDDLLQRNLTLANRQALTNERTALYADLAALQQRHVQLFHQLEEARSHVEALENLIEHFQGEREFIRDKLEDLRNRHESASLLLQDVEAVIAVLTDFIGAVEALIQEVVSWFTDQPITLDEKKERLQELDADLNDKLAEYDSHCMQFP